GTNAGSAKVTKLVHAFKVPIPATSLTMEAQPQRMPPLILHTLYIHRTASIQPKVIKIRAAEAELPTTVQSPDAVGAMTGIIEYPFLYIDLLEVERLPLRSTVRTIEAQAVIGPSDIGGIPRTHKACRAQAHLLATDPPPGSAGLPIDECLPQGCSVPVEGARRQTISGIGI